MNNPFLYYREMPPEFWQLPLPRLFVFLFGAIWGSFLNVCVFRIPHGLSVVRPNSRCPTCLEDIRWHDNLPVLGWFLLRGRCRSCRQRISFRYPAIEALTGALFLLVWVRLGASWHAAAVWLMSFGLLLATLVDLEHYIIPDRVSLGGIAVGLVVSPLVPALHGPGVTPLGALQSAALGAGLGWGMLYLIGLLGKLLLRKEAMGFGDVKFLSAIGAFLGWQAVFFTVIASACAGLVGGILFKALKGLGRKDPFPFGPYLALGAWLWVFYGQAVLDWYFALAFGDPGMP